MSQIYIAVDELGKQIPEGFLKQLEDVIRRVDKIEDFILVGLSNSAELAAEIASIDFNDRKNWTYIMVIMISKEGEIHGYNLYSFWEDFKKMSSPEKTSYEIIYQLLFKGKEQEMEAGQTLHERIHLDTVQYIEDIVKTFTKEQIFLILQAIGIPEWQKVLEGHEEAETVQRIRAALSPISCIPQHILKDDRLLLYFVYVFTERIATRK